MYLDDLWQASSDLNYLVESYGDKCAKKQALLKIEIRHRGYQYFTFALR